MAVVIGVAPSALAAGAGWSLVVIGWVGLGEDIFELGVFGLSDLRHAGYRNGFHLVLRIDIYA